MKTKIFSLATFLMVSSFSGVAQIISSTQSSVPVAGAAINTGISVAPNEDIYAAVYDNGNGFYRIHWLDEVGTTVDGYTRHGSDPDVAYYSNADAVFVAYTNGGHIGLDYYYLNSLNPVDYNWASSSSSTSNIANGVYPNIDCNSSGNGVLCWEDGGEVYVCSFSTGPTVGPIMHVASNAHQPDVALMDNNEDLVITYIRNGDIVIETYNYGDLVSGSLSQTNHWHYNAGQYVYKFPRVATDHQKLFGSLDNFTVVAEFQNTVGGNNIRGFFNTGGMMYLQDINTGLHHCQNSKPVVTYDRGAVNIAWASNAGPSCASIQGGLGDNVLYAQHKFDGSKFTPNQYFEVNDWANGFVSRSPALAAEYDGGYLITSNNHHEAILFSDMGDLFWKGKNANTPPFFKQAGVEESKAKSSFEIMENPVQDLIYVNSKHEETTFILYNNLGKKVSVETGVQSNGIYTIPVKHLPKGIYYLECHANQVKETIKIIR